MVIHKAERRESKKGLLSFFNCKELKLVIKMKKIKDERLILQGLKNIRIAFLILTFGILAILIYDGKMELWM
jgi:hypothetical protein